MRERAEPNRLIHEKSPYLLQHAYNPVDWYAWGDEAFTRARTEEKPVFLSIGYSTCHWCHVMEHESFENDATAAIMNAHFVCIKVDREERPDVDRVYMTALQSMGQGGGWPMSMFLTPDLRPFYGGTYFPPDDRYGRIGFPELLRRIHDVWERDRASVLRSSNDILQHLLQSNAATPSDAVSPDCLETCFQQFRRSYDPEFSGFGNGPKFPRPAVFDFLLRYHHRTGNSAALEMSAATLRRMAEGGMYDHLGGGFHRYSVDGEWRVPHFEKMLYDQAQLVHSSLDLYQIARDEAAATTVREVLAYVMRDMTHPDGGFFSAEDADSPLPADPSRSGEGAFYVWTHQEIEDALGKEDAELFCEFYGVELHGNVRSDPHHEFTGRNILSVSQTVGETAAELGMTETDVNQSLIRSRQRLLDMRNRRPRPHLDDKIITSWNGLMIGAFARAGRILANPAYLLAAERAASFLMSRLFDESSHTLTRRFRDGEAKFDGQLDDYAFLVKGLLDLYENSFDIRRLIDAVRLTEKQIELFWDEEAGAFFDTAGTDPSILVRMKESYDGAEPAGNSVAAMNLLRLAAMTDTEAWRTMAERTFQCYGEIMERQPFTAPHLLAAYGFSVSAVKQVVLAGTREAIDSSPLTHELFSRFLPNTVVLAADGGAGQRWLAERLPFVAGITAPKDEVTAYVCENFACQLPTPDPALFASLLQPSAHLLGKNR